MSLEGGDYKLNLFNMESKWLEGPYFDHSYILAHNYILENKRLSCFPRGQTRIQKRMRILSLLCSMVCANMASHSDLGMAFLLTLMQRLMVTNITTTTQIWAYVTADHLHFLSPPEKTVET